MSFKMGNNVFVVLFTLLLLIGGVYSVSAPSSPARIVNELLSTALSVLMKWVLCLKATTKTAISGRPMVKFESGYTVETVFDGNKLGIDPHSVAVLPDGDLLVLDSANSNLYRISSSLSLYSRPKLVSGSADGYSGHVDGRLREARMNHPKGLTVDDRGNIYIADTDNMAIRKISDTGVSTIAGGKRGRGGGHVDGPSEDAKFSNDFDVLYLGSSCSLLVIDRGNKAICEIQLHFGDCAYQHGSGFPLGIAVLIAASFFGYMLALLRRRVGLIVSSQDGPMQETISQNQYQKPLKPPVIPTEDEQENRQDNILGSFGRLVAQTIASTVEILGRLFPPFPKRNLNHQYQRQQQYPQQQKYSSNSWPSQESTVIPDEDDFPATEMRAPPPCKTYAFMSKDPEKLPRLQESNDFYSGRSGGYPQKQKAKKQQQLHEHHSSPP
ncbi:hypothetical protein CDL12_02337 [Handroanthus impetiginosus]|uniref:Peptidylamidoglycolate lyase n=1 Tax=Handroanthus impetiginosus TaxID=429701 RepID=A0A2G9I5C3_9LAMI|nr:hypothetical protein CDL12_02337 [Handroanthus impetiginosus]